MDIENNNVANKIKKKMKDSIWILEYMFLAIAIVYVIGYIYLVGVNAGFVNQEDIFNVYNFNRIDVVDKTYFQVGIKYIIKYLINNGITVSIGYLFIKLLILYLEKKQKIINDQYNIKDTKRTFVIEVIVYTIILIANSIALNDYRIFLGVIALVIIGKAFIKRKNITNDKIKNILQVSNYMLLYCIWIQTLILINYISIGYKKIDYIFEIYKVLVLVAGGLSIYIINSLIKPSVRRVITIMLIIITFVFIGSIIILDGGKYTIKEIEQYSNKEGQLQTSTIYLKEGNEKKNYINIENSGDKFIGYNLITKSVDIIPKEEIKKIEYINSEKTESYEKYSIDSGIDENTKIVKIVREYYDVLKSGNKAYEWISLNSTNDFYSERYNNISPELLDKRIDSEYINKNNIIKFIGIETTVPKEEKIAKKINGKDTMNDVFTVGVVEIWNDETRYCYFYLFKDEDKYKIFDIRNTKNSFNFNGKG